MENKVALYNSNGIKIGETYIRRARQLIRQQRAMWTDDTETAIRFAPGMDNTAIPIDDATDDAVEHNQLCFARWRSTNYYYPGIVADVMPNHLRISFLDDYTEVVEKEHVLSLQTAFETMEFQGNWSGWGFYHKGVLTSHTPLVMSYNDGTVAEVELKALRCYPAV